MDKEYNLVQDAETGDWKGDVTRTIYGNEMIFPAFGETIDEVVDTIDKNLKLAGLVPCLVE